MLIVRFHYMLKANKIKEQLEFQVKLDIND